MPKVKTTLKKGPIVFPQGHIVPTASLAGHGGTNKLVDYCASKFANVGFDESLRTELYVQVISVNPALKP